MKGEFYKMEYEAWDEGTDDLTLEQEGAYLRLCHQMYRRHGSIPESKSTLARIWRCHKNKVPALIEGLISTGKIERQGGDLTQTRVRQELDHRETISRQRADQGREGGRRSGEVRRKPLKTNKPNEAVASTQTKQNEAEEIRVDKSRVEASKEDVDKNSFFEVGKRIGKLMGVHDDPRWYGNYAMVEAWMNAGYDPDKDIIPVIKSVMARRGNKPPPSTLKYFKTPIEEAYKERTASVERVTTPHGFILRQNTKQWHAWYEYKKSIGEPVAMMKKVEGYTVDTEYPPERKETP